MRMQDSPTQVWKDVSKHKAVLGKDPGAQIQIGADDIAQVEPSSFGGKGDFPKSNIFGGSGHQVPMSPVFVVKPLKHYVSNGGERKFY